VKGLRPRQVYRLRRAFPADEPLVLASRKRETATGTDCAPSADGWPISIRSIAWLSTRRMAPTGRGHFDEVSVSIGGRPIYLWRAAGDEGEVVEVQSQAR
jgi:hypothetical protein